MILNSGGPGDLRESPGDLRESPGDLKQRQS